MCCSASMLTMPKPPINPSNFSFSLCPSSPTSSPLSLSFSFLPSCPAPPPPAHLSPFHSVSLPPHSPSSSLYPFTPFLSPPFLVLLLSPHSGLLLFLDLLCVSPIGSVLWEALTVNMLVLKQNSLPLWELWLAQGVSPGEDCGAPEGQLLGSSPLQCSHWHGVP